MTPPTTYPPHALYLKPLATTVQLKRRNLPNPNTPPLCFFSLSFACRTEVSTSSIATVHMTPYTLRRAARGPTAPFLMEMVPSPRSGASAAAPTVSSSNSRSRRNGSHTHKHTDIQTYRHTDTDTDTHADTEKQTHARNSHYLIFNSSTSTEGNRLPNNKI